jgi:hypothetical protein
MRLFSVTYRHYSREPVNNPGLIARYTIMPLPGRYCHPKAFSLLKKFPSLYCIRYRKALTWGRFWTERFGDSGYRQTSLFRIGGKNLFT